MTYDPNYTRTTPINPDRCICVTSSSYSCPTHGKWPNRYTPDPVQPCSRSRELAETCRVLTELAQHLTNALHESDDSSSYSRPLHHGRTREALDAAAELGITPQQDQPVTDLVVLPTIQAPVVPRIYRRAAIRTWTDHQWDRIPVQSVRIDRIIPTQDAVTIAAIHRWLTNPDDLPARIVYDLERYWLHDGHHRWLIKTLAGHRYLDAHIVDHLGNPHTP